MINEKIKLFVFALIQVLKREGCLLLLVSIFTIIFSWGIFEWYHSLMFIFILLIGRIRRFNMSIATYLVVFTIALNAIGLKQKNSLTNEQPKQLKHEIKKEVVDNTLGKSINR